MKLGFIGCGNMASAIMSGIISNGLIQADEIIGADVFAPSKEKAKANQGTRKRKSSKRAGFGR